MYVRAIIFALGITLFVSCDSIPQEFPIENLRYVLEDGTVGYTDADGLIPESSQNTQFYIGDIALAEPVVASSDALQKVISQYVPQSQKAMNIALYHLDLRGRVKGLESYYGEYVQSDYHYNPESAEKLTTLANMAQLVMSFDQDKNTSNGIQLNRSVHDLITGYSYEFEVDTEHMADSKPLLTWLKQAYDNNLVDNMAVPSAASGLAWVMSQLPTAPVIYVPTEDRATTGEEMTPEETEFYVYNAAGYYTERLEDYDGNGHTNSRAVYTYNSHGREISSTSYERDNGIDDWTQTYQSTEALNEHSWRTTNTFSCNSVICEQSFTLNALGLTTFYENRVDDVITQTEQFLYWDDNATLKAYRRIESSGYMNLSLYDEQGNKTLYLHDNEQNNQSESYEVYTYFENGLLESSRSYGPVTYSVDNVTLAPTITTPSPTLMVQKDVVLEANGLVQSETITATADCTGLYVCIDSTYNYTYDETNILTEALTYPNDVNSSSLDTYTYHPGTDVIHTHTLDYQYGPDSKYQTYEEFNELGQQTLAEKDNLQDGTVDERTISDYENGLLIRIRRWSSNDDILNNLFSDETYEYNTDRQIVLKKLDSDKNGFFETEYSGDYVNGLLTMWQDTRYDTTTEQISSVSSNTYTFESGYFTYFSY